MPFALWADGRRRARCRADAVARLGHCSWRGSEWSFRRPRADSLEADLEVVAKIGATLRTAAAAVSGAEDIAEAEHAAEHVGEVAELGEDARVETGTCAEGQRN